MALWMDCRKFNNETPLDDLGDFIIVSSHLHTEFDAFRKNEIEKNTCYNFENEYSITYVLESSP